MINQFLDDSITNLYSTIKEIGFSGQGFDYIVEILLSSEVKAFIFEPTCSFV